MDKITLFNKTVPNLLIENCYITIDKIHGNSLIYSAFNEKGEFVLKSNEFTNYLKEYYFDKNQNMYVYHLINKCYENGLKTKNIFELVPEDVVCFITSFSCGTTHGFSSMLDLYLEYPGKKKVIVYKDTLPGILQLINLFIDPKLIILLENNSKCKFRTIEFIDIQRHIFNVNTDIEILDNFIDKYIDYSGVPLNKKIGIFKTTQKSNLTSDGSLSESECKSVCQKYKINRIHPEKSNEIEIIRLLKNTETYITTFGTSFTKNIYYLSDKCKKIIVFVIGSEHNNQVYSRIKLGDYMSIPLKFRGIKINYILLEQYVSFDLESVIESNFLVVKNNKLIEYSFKFDSVNLKNYISNYPDLINLNDSELLNHYNSYGKKENRIHEFSIQEKQFNTKIYSLNYPDLHSMSEFELKQHYFIHGEKEGRVYQYLINHRKE